MKSSKFSNDNNERGAAMLEYALIASLLIVGVIGAVGSAGKETAKVYQEASEAIAGTANIPSNGAPGF